MRFLAALSARRGSSLCTIEVLEHISTFMSSLALRVIWVILTLTAIPASWLVLIPFSVATGHWWGQTVYGLTVTVMESVVAIGAFSFACRTFLADRYRR